MYMKPRKTVSLNLHYYKYDRTGTTDINRNASFTFSEDSRLDSLLEFQQDSRKIIKEAIRLADNGDFWYNLSLCVDIWHDDGSLTMYGWSADDSLCVGEDDSGKKYIHFEADHENSDTPEHWDMIVYPDIIKSLADAHV